VSAGNRITKSKKYKTIMKWFNVHDELPQDEVRVLCFHEPSKNYFISCRTKDCLTGEPKWLNGDMPTHWQELTTPTIDENKIIPGCWTMKNR
jgi:hypothetical protein